MQQRTLRVGLIGYGAIGQDISRLLAQQAEIAITLVEALVSHPSKPRPAGSPNIVTTSSAQLVEHPDVVVEVAGHTGLREHGPAIFCLRPSLLVLGFVIMKAVHSISQNVRIQRPRKKQIKHERGVFNNIVLVALGE